MKVLVPYARPYPPGATFVLAVFLLFSAVPTVGAERHLAASQSLKARVQTLDNDEQYVAAFALATERLKLNVPPTDANHDEFIDALTDVVNESMRAGQISLADELSRVLVSETRDYAGDRDIRMASAWRIQGGVLRLFHPREAWMALDEARCILESIGENESDEYARYLWGKGNWYRWSNQQTSLAYMDAGRDLREELSPGRSRDAADMTAWVGWTELHLGHHDRARVLLEESRAMFLDLGLADNSTLGTVYASLGDLSTLDGNWANAEKLYRQGIKCFQIAWSKRGATSKNVPLEGFQLLALSQVRQGKYEDAWRSLQRYRAGQALRASVGSANWRVNHDPDYDGIRRLYDQLIHTRASAEVLKETPHVRPETWTALVNQLTLTARCSRAETEYALKHPLPEASLDQLRYHLDDHTAYVGWLDAKVADYLSASTGPFLNARWMYVVRRAGRIEWTPIYEFKTRADAAVRLQGRDFNAIMNRAALWRERLDVDPDLAALSKGIYGLVFGPGLFDLPNVNRLVAEVAVYDDWIQTDALIDPNGHYLSERYAFSYSPSAAIYVALSEAKPHRKERPTVLAIGDPVFSLAQLNAPPTRPTDSRIDDVILRGAVNHDTTALNQLPRLPYTGRELDRVQALFPDARVIRGREASEVTVDNMIAKDELQHFDIVHVASHALVDPTPDRCAIALSRIGLDGSVSNDGLIDAPEMRMGWKLDAELVTLSACQTAGAGFNRGEPVGFAQALFQAGARCVLLSFWKVDDEATSLLMSRFYENVAAYGKEHKPVSYSESLADAKNWLRNYTDAAGHHPFAHPVYWSGFVLIGDAN